MIGDLLSNMAIAEKLDPQQIQKSGQDGVLPQGIAAALAQNKTQQQNVSSGVNALPQGQVPIGQQILQDATKLDSVDALQEHIDTLKNTIGKLTEGVQLNEIDSRKGIPAWKGIPLLKEKMSDLMQAQAQLQAITNPQPAMPQVAPPIVQPQAQPQAAPPQPPAAPPQGIAAAPSNLPTQGYAGGGIVAFADNPNQPVSADMPPTAEELAAASKPAFYPKARPTNWKIPRYNAPVIEDESQWGSQTPQQAKFNADIAASAPKIGPRAPKVSAAPASAPTPTTPITTLDPYKYTPADMTQQNTGIDTMLGTYAKMLTTSPEEFDKQREIAGWTALAKFGLGLASGSAVDQYGHPVSALGNAAKAGIPAISEYTQAINDINNQKRQQVKDLINLGLTGEQLKNEAFKRGISEEQLRQGAYERNIAQQDLGIKNRQLAAQEKLIPSEIGLRNAQIYHYMHPTANAGLPKGIPFADYAKTVREYEGYKDPKMAKQAPFYNRNFTVETPNGVITWDQKARDFFERAAGTPSGTNAQAKWEQIVDARKQNVIKEGYILSGRASAGQALGVE